MPHDPRMRRRRSWGGGGGGEHIYIYIYIYMHVYIYIYTHMVLHTCACSYICASIFYAHCKKINIRKLSQLNTVCICETYILTHKDTHIYIYMYTHTHFFFLCVYIYIYTHTHTCGSRTMKGQTQASVSTHKACAQTSLSPHTKRLKPPKPKC